MKRPATLTARFVETVNVPGRYGDGRGGHGLSLLVKPMLSTGRLSKSWSQRIRIAGKETNIGMGSYPVVTLAEARRAALANRRHRGEGYRPANRRRTDLRRGGRQGDRAPCRDMARPGQV